MEDIPRDLQRDLTPHRPAIPPRQQRHWTLMFVGETGEVVTLRRFKVWMLFYLTLLLGALVASGAIWIFSGDSRKENRRLKRETAVLQERLAMLRSEKEMLMARLVVTASRNDTAEGDRRPPGPSPETVTQEAVSSGDANTRQPKDTERPQASMTPPDTKEPLGEAIQVPIVNVDDLDISVDPYDGTVQAQFRLEKVTVDGESVKGRTFVILKGMAGDKRIWLSMPPVALEAGRPARIRSGRYFSIARFNIVKFSTPLNVDVDTFEGATVLVYSLKGKQLLEKRFDITVPVASTAED
jgi:hypothetical protein